MKTRIPVENGNVRAALQGFLGKLLETKTVDILLVPMVTPSGTVTPALVSDPALLAAADPLAPVMAVNSATLVGKLSVKEPRPKVGAVLRACEARALVELTKLQQANQTDLTIIAVDCAGTYSVPAYRRQPNGTEEKRDGLWQALFADPAAEHPELRAACKICEQPVYSNAAISIDLFGSDLTQEIRLTVADELAGTLGLEDAGENTGRDKVIEGLVAARTTSRDTEFAAIRARLEGPGGRDVPEGIQGVFAACIRCHNCMNVCPICYCKTCVFKSAIFDHQPAQYVQWTHQKGAYRMPSDTMLFHLTRLNHMVLSCVGCGMCTEACPSELPVGMVFRAIGQRVQATFEYAPGRSLEESLPLITFKADEWHEVGE